MLKKIFRDKRFILAFLVTGITANYLGNNFIKYYFPDRPLVKDLVFSLTPKIMWLQYISDPILIFGMLALVWLFWVKSPLKRLTRRKILKQLIFAISLAYWLRGTMIILTPMARPETTNQSYGIFKSIVQNGMFPSGHAGLAYLLYLYSTNLKVGKKWENTFLGLFISQIIILLLSRGHYSIDIIGGIMLYYISYRKAQDLAEEGAIIAENTVS